MRVIMAGTRTLHDYEGFVALVERAKKYGLKITTILSGGARGVDAMAERYAKANKIPVEVYKADWLRYNNAAGPLRNKIMAKRAQALLAVWSGHSKGTADMIRQARENGLRVFIFKVD